MRSAYRLFNHLLIGWSGSRRHSRNGAKDPEQELAGQVGPSLIFSNVSNYDRGLRNPKEHAGSITVPRVGVYR
jgi:hypothetical protein